MPIKARIHRHDKGWCSADLTISKDRKVRITATQTDGFTPYLIELQPQHAVNLVNEIIDQIEGGGA